jgi:hypothetical protein
MIGGKYRLIRDGVITNSIAGGNDYPTFFTRSSTFLT